jgi:hypothetical protein
LQVAVAVSAQGPPVHAPAGFHHFVFTNARAEPMPAPATTISTKRLSLVKQMLPNMRRVAMLWNRDDLGMSLR